MSNANFSHLIDTHCHLDNPIFDDQHIEMIKNCFDKNIKKIINPSINVFNIEKIIFLSHEINDHFNQKIMFPAVGLHPIFLNDHHFEHLDLLEIHLNHYKNQIVAVGEIGIDLFLLDLDLKQQIFYFTEQLKLAKKYDLPVIIHSRKAHDIILKYLNQIKVKGGIIHAFNGSRQQADRFIQMNFKLGFGGSLTYSKYLNIIDLAKNLPLESIVLETDAPEMHPSFLEKSEPNSPIQIEKIAQKLAEIRQISIEEIMNQTYQNAISTFNLN